jgi:hypothetical protein
MLMIEHATPKGVGKANSNAKHLVREARLNKVEMNAVDNDFAVSVPSETGVRLRERPNGK